MHVGVDFSRLLVIYSLYFGRKWAETGERLTATTTIFWPRYYPGRDFPFVAPNSAPDRRFPIEPSLSGLDSVFVQPLEARRPLSEDASGRKQPTSVLLVREADGSVRSVAEWLVPRLPAPAKRHPIANLVG